MTLREDQRLFFIEEVAAENYGRGMSFSSALKDAANLSDELLFGRMEHVLRRRERGLGPGEDHRQSEFKTKLLLLYSEDL